jgi:glycosyltransferase involved in cell wall biosynthesis
MRDRLVWWQHQIPAGHWVDRVATLLPARAIGCSSQAGQRAQGTLSPKRRSFVVNPGIEIARARGGNRVELREQLDIPTGRQVLGIIGRLQPWKGQDRFLTALAELCRGGRDVHGLLVGGDAYELSPEYAAGLDRLVRELGLSGRVTMTGQVPDSAPYLELMDVAVNASEEEPFGIVLLEAMAAGVPVVAVAKGGPVDIVEPGVTGILARSGDPTELAAAMDALLADSSLRAEMAVAAKNRCRQRFTAELMVEQLTTQLTEIHHG